MLVHATTVDLAGAGVLILGASGAGKSRAGLQLLQRGALLVSDDQTELREEGEALIATAPPTIAGLIEVRGVGLLKFATIKESRICLAVLLSSACEERMPERDVWRLSGSSTAAVPLARLNSQENCVSDKIIAALGNAFEFKAS